MKIFFIGLGKMGAPMASNLINQGYNVKIFDINKALYKKFKSKKVQLAHSINELVEGYDIVFSMVPDGNALKKIILNKKNKIYNNKKNSSTWIDCSSIDYQTTVSVFKILKRNNVSFLDAPVSGGVTGAKNASLSIMVGGELQTFKKVKKVLSCLGTNISYLGSSGSGQIVKACNNMMLGINMIGISEAFTMAKAFGIKEKEFFNICSVSTSSSWAMLNHIPIKGLVKNSAANNNFKPGYAAKLINKDLKISQAMANKIGINVSLGKKASSLYNIFCKEGNDNLDYSAIIKTLKKK